ncbi:MAG: pirin family protein [Hyphomonadaceae bacterium]|nr:pirin family protein [Hyphomonadaceae bacterium]
MIELLLRPKAHDLGDGFVVRRALPQAQARAVGPFVFLDQMGPVRFAPGQGIDVRPHPHIGLATITFLYEGEILHRDSLGFVQPIRPGEVNWMSAGKGIVHSERTRDEVRAAGGAVFGLQAWVALPLEHEESEPSFTHVPADALPRWSEGGAELTLIAGRSHGKSSPTPVLSELVYVSAAMPPGSTFKIPAEHAERAIHLADGAIELDGRTLEPGDLAVLGEGEAVARAIQPSRVALLGGAPLDAPRTIWWNFVSSRKDRLEEAKALWRAGGFERVPGDPEFIPLPEH